MEQVGQLGQGIDVGVAQSIRGTGEHGLGSIADRTGHSTRLITQCLRLEIF